MTQFGANQRVRHPRFGTGTVRFHDGPTAFVRFDHGAEELPAAELAAVETYEGILRRAEWDPAPEAIARALGDAIRSVNDAWGVFSRSKVALLPHQHWVCKQVNRTRPARWLVADDVGLGKTIEAGLILLPLIASGEVRRLLVLCPASLVGQWQERMRDLFDIRLAAYYGEADTPAEDFWGTQSQVVASLHTLRHDERGRYARLLAAAPWDMVVVDEAHHLNADEQSGPTLGYRLVEKLDAAGRVGSLVFFTGTPHRGKEYGFVSLLKLLRPDWFDPERPLEGYLPRLREARIRDDGHEGTDLDGKSTEAGGEGIDLQRHCFSLVHVDLPWNPMRMQQRVGRLNRYGQTRRVEIDTLRNPDTVEARIWDKLNAKIAPIMRALGPLMAQPEDLLQLVLGMASPGLFRGVFAESGGVPAEDLTGWFDTRTAQFGGREALEAVRALVGNAARFDFRAASAQIPRLDLPDLKPFFELMPHVNRRRVAGGAGGLEFQTPEGWRGAAGVRPAYSGVAFDRAGIDPDCTLGVGHKVMDAAVAQARGLPAVAAGVPDDLLAAPLAVFRVTDRVTTGAGVVRAVTVGVSGAPGDFTRVRDWELVRDLNRVLGRDPRRYAVAAVADAAGVAAAVAEARGWLSARLGPLDLPLRYPELALTCVLVPWPRVTADEIGTARA